MIHQGHQNQADRIVGLDPRNRGHTARTGVDGEKTSCTSDRREGGYSGGQVVDPEEASDVARRYTSVKMENRTKKFLETVSLSQSTPVKTEEREPALLAAAFRVLSSSSVRRRGIVELANCAL
jgi:hypothetical protein